MIKKPSVEFSPTESWFYHFRGVDVNVHISNRKHAFEWRLEVDGEMSPIQGESVQLFKFKGFGISRIEDGILFESLVPFKLEYASLKNSGRKYQD